MYNFETLAILSFYFTGVSGVYYLLLKQPKQSNAVYTLFCQYSTMLYNNISVKGDILLQIENSYF